MEPKHLSASAIIVAGGVGSRAASNYASKDASDRAKNEKGDELPKQLKNLGGKPVILWSVEAFAHDDRFTQIIIVCPDSLRDQIKSIITPHDVIFATGGATRTASVRAGLSCVDTSQTDLIFVHDAARPGLNKEVLDQLFNSLASGIDGAAPARPVADALWHVTDTAITTAIDREGLMRIQTPQAFHAIKLVSAYGALAVGEERADDVAVARDALLQIITVKGSERLDKITWHRDFERMEHILTPPLLPRVGSGFDAHKFVSGNQVTLCGIEIAHVARLAGHSDADVGWHALADAIYGALSAGDIGHHFPPSEPRWKGMASRVFLKHAGDMVTASGGAINHVDVTLICEAPKVGPHRDAMAAATAMVLGLRIDQVSIKATTTEAMGFTGRREGIAAQASATVLLPQTFRKAVEVPC